MCSKIQFEMKYAKWQCIPVFKCKFSHIYVQYLVRNENSIIKFKFAISYAIFNMQNKNIFLHFIS